MIAQIKPLALDIADRLDLIGASGETAVLIALAANEIRRLHSLVETLSAELRSSDDEPLSRLGSNG
jgi:hypothetical protein